MEEWNLPTAFILLSIKPGMDFEIYKKLNREDIAEIYQVFGLYDMIIKTKEIEDMNKIEQILAYIRQLEGITNTITMLVRISAP
ncbi:MAG: Lrp/AsnC ligand binding domain-containing protein [Candidatus Hodarchaeota archaeon]